MKKPPKKKPNTLVSRMPTIIDSYNKNYQIGDALIMYMCIDELGEVGEWLYQHTFEELILADDFSLGDYDVTDKIRSGKLKLYHATDLARFDFTYKKKWMSASTLAGAGMFLKYSNYPDSYPCISQVLPRYVHRVFNVREWAEDNIGRIAKYFAYNIEVIKKRIKNEDEYIVLAKTNPLSIRYFKG